MTGWNNRRQVKNRKRDKEGSSMNALIVFDAQSWSAGQMALAIAGTLAKSAYVRAVDVADINGLDLQGVDILILGCATQRWKPTPAMQGFLNSIPEGSLDGISLAIFDTRFPVPRPVTGSAARAMASELRKRGGSVVVPPQSFHRLGKEASLKKGEVERAVRWARTVTKTHRAYRLFRLQ
jgi:hypothetical protein